MENEELDLTLKLGLPNPTVDTRLSLTTPANADQGTNVVGGGVDNNDGGQILTGNDADATNNVDVNISVYTYVFQHFAGTGETLNFAHYPMPPSLSHAPAPVTPHVSHLNSFLAMPNAWNGNANAAGSFGSGGRIEAVRKCMNKYCNALNTPLWRRGPLGPKSLCNACGIKFRKEEERRNKRDSH